jgi:type I protein arginine methyltransferase
MQTVVGSHNESRCVIPLQAGAKHVYAIEASEMAEYAHKLIAGNPLLGQRITVRFFFFFQFFL